MNLILLPGNSSSHREWIDRVEAKFSPAFENTYTQYYDHWFRGDEQSELDLAQELDKAVMQADEFEPYLIVAKSAGCLVTLKGIHEGVLSPRACVFIGLPKAWAEERGLPLGDWLRGYDTPSLFVQQRQDPVFFGTELEGYLHDQLVTHYEIKIIDGATHNYDDINLLFNLTNDFIDFE